ncbi:DUF916 and DUF3324 domain-containing protein [Lactiplantibacillus modestisalitolerans]|uniref:DUF916 and DUF3324 domain-containing protein n=1 Tax=Lactiplantibacillus modestisalitolerans TaxID=1457219 RepID=A0ABV5WTU5_9LACO|nr:DUF916 and DUF3324 domain-containing protein [Lactiplantibacillus modestisalitolerans]
MHKLIRLVVMLVLTFIGSGLTAMAAKTPTSNFTVTPILPDNQIDRRTSYFDLKVEPNASQELQVKVSNPATSRKTLRIMPINATTADGGQAVYVPSPRQDPSATTTFTKMTSPAVTVELAPKEAKTVTFRSRIPRAGFSGQVLGGIFVTDTKSQATTTKAKRGFALRNRYAEVVAVSMWCQPRTVPVELRLAQVKTADTNQQPTVSAKIRNVTPVLFGQMKIEAQVIQQSTGKTIATQQLKNGSMAPNSWFNYQVNLGKRTLSAGDYLLKLHLTTGKRDWKFSEHFELSTQRAQQHNRKLKQPQSQPWLLWITLAAVGVIGLLGAAYWIGRHRSREE